MTGITLPVLPLIKPVVIVGGVGVMAGDAFPVLESFMHVAPGEPGPIVTGVAQGLP